MSAINKGTPAKKRKRCLSGSVVEFQEVFDHHIPAAGWRVNSFAEIAPVDQEITLLAYHFTDAPVLGQVVFVRYPVDKIAYFADGQVALEKVEGAALVLFFFVRLVELAVLLAY
jgi:hypothetical protein